MLIFVIWAIILSYQHSFAWRDLLHDDSPQILLSQLMILTVVDLSNEEVTRDAFTFLRSIRLFGGDLNRATLVLGFTGIYDNYGIDTLPLSTLSQYASYNVEFDFIFVAESQFARNMNKLSSFSLFDPVRFAYLLWLDADMLVLQDPSPFLRQHRYPGAIKCLPEFYNYMIRYPDINSSSLFWNPSLPSFHLLGSGEVAPAGTCNTGVLLLDTYTVVKLHNRAMKALEEDIIPSGFLRDRFLDSLIFVYAINNESINLQLFPQTMNYMSFFEGEIMAAFNPPPTADEIVLTHMLWTTEFHCHLTTNDSISSCNCTYINEHYNENSALTQALQSKIMNNETACHALATNPSHTVPTPTATQSSHQARPTEPYPCESSENKQSPLLLWLDCSLIWPPTDTEEIHILLTPQQVLTTDIFINCDFNSISAALSQLSYLDPLTVKGRVHFRQSSTDKQQETWTRYTHDLIFTMNDSQQIDDNMTKKMSLKSSMTILLQDSFPARQRMEFYLSIALVSSTAEGNQCIAVISHSFSKLIVIQSLQPAGQIMYSRNQLIGQKSISLASQLLLPEFLQVHRLHVGRGIMFCCDTNKGVKTVQRLITMTKNAYLLIFITNTPSDYRPPLHPSTANEDIQGMESSVVNATVQMMQGMIGEACQAAGRNRCKVILTTTTEERDIFLPIVLTRLRRYWYDYVYLDASSWQSSAVYDEILKQCYEVLKTGGLFMGSRYWSAPPQFMLLDGLQLQPPLRVNKNKTKLLESYATKGNNVQLMKIRNTVDKLSYKSTVVLLQTYAEREDIYCDDEKVKEEYWPAWYLFKP